MEDNIKISKSPDLKLAFSVTLALITGFILGGLFPVNNYLNLQKATSLDSEFAEKSLNENGRVGLSDDSLDNNGQILNRPYLYNCTDSLGSSNIIFDLPTDNPPQNFQIWTSANCNLVVAKMPSEGELSKVLNLNNAIDQKKNTLNQNDNSVSNYPSQLIDRKYSCKFEGNIGDAWITDFPDPPFNYPSFSFNYSGGTVVNCKMVSGL